MVLKTKPDPDRLSRKIHKGAHSSTRQQASFFCAKVLDQAHKGHLLVLPLAAVKHLPDLWLLLAACILQEVRCNILIYNCTYSGLNREVTPTALHDAM